MSPKFPRHWTLFFALYFAGLCFAAGCGATYALVTVKPHSAHN